MPFSPFGSVAGDHGELIRDTLQLVFPVKQIGTSRLDDRYDAVAFCLECPGYRINAANTVPATDTDHGAKFFDFGRYAQGADHRRYAGSHGNSGKAVGGVSDIHEEDGESSALRVPVRDGQRNAF